MTMPEKGKVLNLSSFSIFALFIICMASLIFALVLRIFPVDTYDVGGITLSLNVLETALLLWLFIKTGKEEGT